jgi:hypothetical protein
MKAIPRILLALFLLPALYLGGGAAPVFAQGGQTTIVRSGGTLPACSASPNGQLFALTGTGAGLYFCPAAGGSWQFLLVPANTTAVTHQWISAYNSSTGAFSQSQPAAGDISGLATSATTDTTNASNITSGTLSHDRLPTLLSGDIPNNAANTSGNAATATALAGSPTQCSGNNFSTGITSSGNANCAQPGYSQISGTPTLEYQTAQQSGVAQTQRGVYNFLAPLVVSDNASNGSTDVTCANCLNVANNAQGANQIISGGMVEWTGNYNFTIGTATYTIAGTSYTSSLTNLTLATPDATKDRIDTIAVDNTGVVVVLQGDPADTPLAPTVDPATQLELSFVYVTANSSAPSLVTRNDIYHSNTEWTTSRSGTVFTLASTNNPYDTTVDVEATNATLNSWVQFQTPSGTVDLGTVNALVFYIRSKATWNAARNLSISWRSSGATKGSTVVLRDGTFGFSSSLTGSYQQISIPTSLFGISGVAVNNVRMTVSGSGSTTIGFYLDDVTLQAGVATTSLPNGIMIFRGAWSSSTAYQANDVVTNSGANFVALLPGTNNNPVSATSFWARLSAAVPSFSDAEVPGGALNGSNTAFTLAHAPSPAGSLALALNGVILKAGGVDYTLSGTGITMAGAPASVDALLAWYRY